MERFERSLKAVTQNDALSLSPVALAYLGDTVYDLYVRSYLVKNRMGTVRDLHAAASSVVNARAQAAAAEALLPVLTEEEAAVYKRGRNAKSGGVPKNMDTADYRKATGLEAVLGYLYALGRRERLDELMRRALNRFLPEG